MITCDLHVYRRQAGMSMRELAKAVGTSAGHICDVENQRSMPGIELAYRIANALNTPLTCIWRYHHD